MKRPDLDLSKPLDSKEEQLRKMLLKLLQLENEVRTLRRELYTQILDALGYLK